jgi:hypothetical protein
MGKVRILRPVLWWLTGNAIALITWLLIAWAIWPWPNYGYCDFLVASWRFVFAESPFLIFLGHVVLLLVVLGYAVLHRKATVLFAVLFTAVVWFVLAGYDFNPNAVPGDGCFEGIDLSPPEKTAK